MGCLKRLYTRPKRNGLPSSVQFSLNGKPNGILLSQAAQFGETAYKVSGFIILDIEGHLYRSQYIQKESSNIQLEAMVASIRSGAQDGGGTASVPNGRSIL
jgi:hypothetical protein